MGLIAARALNLLRVVSEQKEISQRELADQLDVSLGTANQTIRVLVGCGVLETHLITTAKGKRGQSYRLTETGRLEQKKLAEIRIQEIEEQIQSLQREAETLKTDSF